MKKKEPKDSKIQELEDKIAELTLGWQRAQADFLNYKKQAAEDKIKFCQNANANLLCELLPVLDNFQLAAKHIPKNLEGDNWAQGIKQIELQFENILKNEGLERIETVGKMFDPNLHEAVDHIESEKPEDEVVEEVLSGYVLNGLVLRPARVKVSKGK